MESHHLTGDGKDYRLTLGYRVATSSSAIFAAPVGQIEMEMVFVIRLSRPKDGIEVVARVAADLLEEAFFPAEAPIPLLDLNRSPAFQREG